MKDYIEATALDFSVAFETPEVIDKINILNASISAMHKAIDGLNIVPESLLIDGNKFKPYVRDGDLIPHECFVKGDDLYQSISAASILAKVYHDNYITELCEKEPELDIYDWKKICVTELKYISMRLKIMVLVNIIERHLVSVVNTLS